MANFKPKSDFYRPLNHHLNYKMLLIAFLKEENDLTNEFESKVNSDIKNKYFRCLTPTISSIFMLQF